MKQQIEYVEVKKLIPYARNSRTHSDEQVAQICGSIKEFGFTNPVLIDGEGVIIAGHGRTIAAQRLNMKEVPCLRLDYLTEAQKKAYVIADNKLALNAGWDDEMLALELGDLKELDFDLSLTGFDDDELNKLLVEAVNEGLVDEDEAPPPPDEPISKLGDIWQLGSHRVMCGDSTSIDAVDKLMEGQKADMVFTDPPYGIDFAPQRGTHDKIMNDNLDESAFSDFLDASFLCAFSYMKPDTYAFVWTGWSKIGAFEKSLKKFFKIQAMHVWVKNNFGIGYYSRPKHEPFYLCLNGKPVYPANAPADVWEAKKVHKTVHSCEKPVDLIVNIFDTYHKNSEVLDLFGGSGSTLIACEKSQRKAHLMELDPKYCDVIVTRWQDYTGKQAIHAETGKTFAEMANG
jgi:DNA modification methylase